MNTESSQTLKNIVVKLTCKEIQQLIELKKTLRSVTGLTSLSTSQTVAFILEHIHSSDSNLDALLNKTQQL